MNGSNEIVSPRDVLDFWFAAGPEKWFAKDSGFDAEIASTFGATHTAACRGACDGWMENAQGALALIILLDQFSRNLYRGDHRAFMQDEKALALTEQAISRRYDVELPIPARKWIYMPFMHSESLDMQKRGVEFFATRCDDAETLDYARLHEDIIRRFGRFPHRNTVLGRRTTPSEQDFLNQGGFAG